MAAEGNYTGEIVKSSRPRTYEAVIEDLAHDKPVNHITRVRRVTDHTVKAIAKREADRIATRKKSLAVMFETLCERSIRRASKTVRQATFAQACVGAGIAADNPLVWEYSRPGPTLVSRSTF